MSLNYSGTSFNYSKDLSFTCKDI